MNAIIIRFDNEFAVCRKESKAIFKLYRNLLPSGAEEGDVLEIIGNRISINVIQTKERKDRVRALINDIIS